MNTDRWYYRVFQSAPDLIRSLLPGSAAGANTLSLDPDTPAISSTVFKPLKSRN